MKKLLFLFAPFVIFILIACVPKTSTPVAEATQTITPSAPAAIDLGILGHGMAKTATWSADGKILAVGSTRGIYLYDTTTWQAFQFIEAQGSHYNGVEQIWFHADGNMYYAYVSNYYADMTLGLYQYDLSSNKSTRMYPDLNFDSRATIVFSADGSRFANVGAIVLDANNEPRLMPYVEIRETATGKVMRTLKSDATWQGEFTHKQAAFSPNGELFTTGGGDNTVRIWDINNGLLLFEQKHDADIRSLVFSPDGKMLVSAGDDATIRFWDSRTGESLRVLREFDRRVTYLAYSMNESDLLIGLSDGFFQRWTIDERFLPAAHKKDDFNLERREYAGTDLSEYISPDGSRLAVIDESNPQILDLTAASKPIILVEFNSYLTAIEFSPDGNLLALVDHNVHLWDMESRKAVGILQVNAYKIADVAFTPDGQQLAITSNTLQIWDVATRQKIKEMDTIAHLAAYSPDGVLLATGDWYDVTIWNAESGKKIRGFKSGLSTPYALSFTADGNALIFAAQDGIKMWDVSSGKLLRAMDAIEERIGEALIYSSDHVAIRNILNCTDGGELNFQDLGTGLPLYTLNIPSCALKDVAFHPSGRLFVYTSGYDKSFQITMGDPVSGQSLFDIPLPGRYIDSIRFSPDGRLLAAQEISNTVYLWDISSIARLAETMPALTATPLPTRTPIPSPTPAIAEEIPQSLATPRAPIPGAISVDNINDLKEIATLGDLRYEKPNTAAWSSDGKMFALGSLGTVSVYKVGVSTPWRTFAGGDLVESLAFSPDGHFLAEQNNMNKTIVWDLLTDKRARTFTFNEGCWISKPSFSADSQTLVITECAGEERRFFDVASGKLITKEKIRLHGSLNFDGSLLVVSDSYYVYLKDTQSGNILRTFEPGARPWQSLFSPDGQTMLIWSYGVQFEKIINGEKWPTHESVAELWQVVPGQQPNLRRTILTGPANMEVPPKGQTYAFTSDGKHLITTVWDGFTRIWDTDTGQLLSEIQGGYQVFLSADDKTLITVYFSGRVQVWDLTNIRKPKPIQTVVDFEEQYFSCPVFTDDGKEVAALNTRTSIANWEITKKPLDPKPVLYPVKGEARTFAASPDGTYWATDNPNGSIDLRDSKTGRMIRTLVRAPESLSGNDVGDMINTLLFSNPGDMLLAANSRRVWVWDVKTGKMTYFIELDIPIGDIDFSPDGRLLAFSENVGKKAEIWDAQTGKRLRHFDSAGGKIAFSPNGLTLAAGAWNDGKIQLLDVRSGQTIGALQAEKFIWDLTFTPDGSMLIVSAVDKMEFWDVAQGIRVKAIKWYASCLSLSPDGTILATDSRNSGIQLWGTTGQ